jgi:hypothetical protein
MVLGTKDTALLWKPETGEAVLYEMVYHKEM